VDASPAGSGVAPLSPELSRPKRSPVIDQTAEVEEVRRSSSEAPLGRSDKPLAEQLRRRTALMAVDLQESVHNQIRNLFGNGQRVDPKTWVAFAEHLQHSGQAQPMAGHLSTVDHESIKAKQAADNEHVDFLSDSRILQVIRDLPAKPSTARLLEARRPSKPRAMSAAFTDRGVRLREGQAAQAIFNYRGPTYQDPGPSNQDSGELPNEWHAHAAGQPTHACTHNIVADPSNVGKHSFPQAHSPGVRKAFEYAQGCAHEHELLFQQSMKRKGRVSKEQTSQGAANAGQYRRPKMEGTFKKSPEGGNPTLLRSGASYVLNPRDQDPPHPHDRICNARKARGEFKHGFTKESHRQATHWNQDLYRFEVLSYGGDVCRALYRTASCPPKSGSRNPITGQQDENKTPRRPTEHEQRARDKSGKSVKTLTNHHVLEKEARQSRESRMNTDPHFATLCKAGAELDAQRAAEVSKIKATQFRGLSVNVANALRWDD